MQHKKEIEGWCCDKSINPMYSDIGDKDYFEPIKRYSQENNDYFKKMIANKEINDFIMQLYIK